MASPTYGNIVYGCRDIKITNIGGTTQEDLGAAVTAEFVPELEGGILKGDDANKGSVFYIVGGQLKFSAGEYSAAALAIMLGLTLATTSSTPTEVTTLQLNAGQRLPYFKFYAQALDEGAGDLQLQCYKVKLSGMPGFMKLENGNFRMNEFEAECFDDSTNGVAKVVQHETAVAVPAS